MSALQEEVLRMLDRQMEEWELAARNYGALEQALTHELPVDGASVRVQYNPARTASTTAGTDKEAVGRRPCFLCPDHLPPGQLRLPFGRYLVLCNPYPIFRRHLTIPACGHAPQRIRPRLRDLLELSRQLPGFTLFYNGPLCGASAPDHAHFQAVPWGDMPVDREWEAHARLLSAGGGMSLYLLCLGGRNGFAVRSSSMPDAASMLGRICSWLPVPPGEEEPMMNLFAHYGGQYWELLVIARKRHRPWQYAAEGADRFLSSPGAADVGGVFVTVRESDFCRADASLISDIFRQVCFSAEEVETFMAKNRDK